MILAVELERHMVSTRIFCFVVYKFCHREKPCLVILLLIDKSLEKDFFDIVLPLCMTIYLRIKGCKQLLLDSKKEIKTLR